MYQPNCLGYVTFRIKLGCNLFEKNRTTKQNMNIKKIHYFSGITISIFVGLHLINHLYSVFGVKAHIELMNNFRLVYRNIIIETILLIAVGIQIISGIKLFLKKRKNVSNFFEKLQIWTGVYLTIFLLIHVSANFSEANFKFRY